MTRPVGERIRMKFNSFLALAVKTAAKNARSVPTDTEILVGEGRLRAFVAVTLVAEALYTWWMQ